MAYGTSPYGILLYSAEPEDAVTEPSSPPDLMAYLPMYYENSRVMRSVQGTISEELGLLKQSFNEILLQFFVKTATWGLAYWEREMGLTVDASKSVDRRREQVKARLRGAGTTSAAMIVSAAAAFSGGDVRVTEFPSEYRFEIQFVGVKGIPPNMAGFLAMIEEIKPAHLAYSFKYTYTTWSNLSSLNWVAAGVSTWDQLKIFKGA